MSPALTGSPAVPSLAAATDCVRQQHAGGSMETPAGVLASLVRLKAARMWYVKAVLAAAAPMSSSSAVTIPALGGSCTVASAVVDEAGEPQPRW